MNLPSILYAPQILKQLMVVHVATQGSPSQWLPTISVWGDSAPPLFTDPDDSVRADTCASKHSYSEACLSQSQLTMSHM